VSDWKKDGSHARFGANAPLPRLTHCLPLLFPTFRRRGPSIHVHDAADFPRRSHQPPRGWQGPQRCVAAVDVDRRSSIVGDFNHLLASVLTPPSPAAGKGWNWYEGMIFGAKTKMNMYFYGTLLDKTQKDEPAGRSVHQVRRAFLQACFVADMSKNVHVAVELSPTASDII
jgi:hypothetical protein